MFQLIYTSSIKDCLHERSLKKLSKDFAISNKQRNITGILLSHNGMLMQVLEGEENVVRDLMSKIEHDDRHSGLMILTERHLDKREFENWSMGYRHISATDPDKTLFQLTLQSLKNSLPESPSPELDTLTRTFIRVSGL